MEELHRLVNELPDDSLSGAAVLLERAKDPVVAKLDAVPYDDEELTNENRRAVDDAADEFGVPWSEAVAKLNAD